MANLPNVFERPPLHRRCRDYQRERYESGWLAEAETQAAGSQNRVAPVLCVAGAMCDLRLGYETEQGGQLDKGYSSKKRDRHESQCHGTTMHLVTLSDL